MSRGSKCIRLRLPAPLCARFSVALAATRLTPETVVQCAALCQGVDHAAPAYRKESLVGGFAEHHGKMPADERLDFDAVMLSPPGKTFPTALRNLNPGVMGGGGCANATAAYFAERLACMQSARAKWVPVAPAQSDRAPKGGFAWG